MLNVSSVAQTADGRRWLASKWATSLNYGIAGMAVVTLVLVLFIFVTAFGNCLVIVAIFRYRFLRTVSNFLIGNLAFSDLLLAVTILPLSSVNECLGHWIFGRTMCNLWLTLDVLYCTASIWNLCMIAFDRFTATLYPLWYYEKRSTKQAAAYVGLIWMISGAICVPPALGWGELSQNYVYNNTTTVFQCVLFQTPGYVLYSASGSFYIPFVITFFLYIRIFSLLRRRMQKMSKARAPLSMKATDASDCWSFGLRCFRRRNSEGVTREAELCHSEMTPKETSSRRGRMAAVDNGRRDDRRLDIGVPVVVPTVCEGSSCWPASVAMTEDERRIRRRRRNWTEKPLPSTADVLKQRSPGGTGDDRSEEWQLPSAGNSSEERRRHSSETTYPPPCDRCSSSVASDCPAEVSGAEATPSLRASLGALDMRTSRDQSPSKGISRRRGPLNGRYFDAESMDKVNRVPRIEAVLGMTKALDIANMLNASRLIDGQRTRRDRSKDEASDSGEGGGGGTAGEPSRRLRRRRLEGRETKATVKMAIIIAFFCGMWMGFFVVYMVRGWCPNACHVPRGLEAFFFWLGYTNSSMNPVLYTLFNDEFRKAFKKILRCYSLKFTSRQTRY